MTMPRIPAISIRPTIPLVVSLGLHLTVNNKILALLVLFVQTLTCCIVFGTRLCARIDIAHAVGHAMCKNWCIRKQCTRSGLADSSTWPSCHWRSA